MRTSGEIHKQHLTFLYATERTISGPIKWGIFVSGAALLSYWHWEAIPLEGAITLTAYAIQNLAFTILFAREGLSLRAVKLLILVSYAFDFVFVAHLIFGLGGTASQVAFLMYISLIFKAGLYYPAFHKSLLILPLAVGFYLSLLGIGEGPEAFGDYALRPRLFLLLGIPAVTMYTARLLDYRERSLWELNSSLQARTDELRRKGRELEAVIRGMRDGLLVTDSMLNVVALNPVAESILGLEPDSPVPVPLAFTVNGLALRDAITEALAGDDDSGKRDIELPPKVGTTGECQTYQAVASRIPGENDTGARVVVILRDVTEQARLENAKSNFLSVISHELRTPLSSIKGFLNIILGGRAGPLTETQKDFLMTAKGQAEYLHAMINDVVEFSRIRVRQTTLDASLVSLAEIARSAVTRLMPIAQDKAVRLVNRVPDDLPLVEGDQFRLDQVVVNLVCNAIKFTPQDGTVTLSAHERASGEIVFSVQDTGIGIPAEQKDRIFEPFYQVSDGPARLHGGMGLGLAICKHVIDLHGGRLSVESVEGKGSVFHFELPREASLRSLDSRGAPPKS